MAGKGIEDLTSARWSDRIATGNDYCTDPYIGDRREFFHGSRSITVHAIDYKTNATWSESELISDKCNYPLVLRDDYGMGEFYILNIPDNYSNIYDLPVPVMTLIRKLFAAEHRVYIEAGDRYNLFLYDNDAFVVQSYRDYREYMKVIIRGECKSMIDMQTGKEYWPVSVKDQPAQRFDVSYVKPSPKESVFEVYFMPGVFKFFKINP